MTALLRYCSHFRLDPQQMELDEFVRAWADLEFALVTFKLMDKE